MNKYPSPTTPGLEVTFSNYVIELICLNMNAKLCPRFWKYGDKYWHNKYRREIKGVSNLLKKFEFLDNPLLQKTIVLDIKSLLIKKTFIKAEKAIRKYYNQALVDNKKLEAQPDYQIISSNKNAKFVDVSSKTKLGKLREICNGK